MKTRVGLIVGLAAIAAGTLSVGCGMLRAVDQEKRTLLRVGVYDSRAVVIAYAPSKYNEAKYQAMKAELDKAEAAGDAEKAKAIKEEGKRGQERMHLQGFGSAPVHNLLEPVKDKLPKLAADCGVDVIVSKWEFDYLASDAAVKDITDELVALYEPNDKALNWIRQMKDIAPRPEKEILEHEH